MIQLEYDARTSGTRISFVIWDGEVPVSLSDPFGSLERMTNRGDKKVAPQTANNLEIIQALLDAAKLQRK